MVATLQAVPDAPTRHLVRDFYDAGAVDDPVAALAIAQRRALRRGAPAAEWAPFVVFDTIP